MSMLRGTIGSTCTAPAAALVATVLVVTSAASLVVARPGDAGRIVQGRGMSPRTDTISAATPPTMTILVGTPHAVVPLRSPDSCTDASAQSAELRGPAGFKARGVIDCFYGSTLYLHFIVDAQDQPFDPAASDFPVITSGDTIVVRSGATTITGDVPALSGDVSADGARAFGRLAPGVATTLAVFRGTLDGIDALWPYLDREGRWWERFRTPSERLPVKADGAGAWTVDLGAAASPLAPGDSALIEQRDAAGNRYVMGVAPPTLVVGRAFGHTIVTAQATNGLRLAVEITVPGVPPIRFTGLADLWGWSPTTFEGPAGAILPGFAPQMGALGARDVLPPGTEIAIRSLGLAGTGDGEGDGKGAGGADGVEQRMRTSSVDLSFAPANAPSTDGGYDAVGHAGPGRTVDVRVAGPLGLQHAVTATADVKGAFIASLSMPLDSGWRALVVEHEGAIGAASYLTRRHVRVAVGSPFVYGLMGGADMEGDIDSGGRDVTTTLRAADGHVLASGRCLGLGGGSWMSTLEGPDLPNGDPGPAVVAAPGTTVEVAFDDGDPVIVPVGDLTAAVAPNGDGLFGTAPPGASVLLSGTDGDEAAVGASGTYGGIDGLAIRAGARVVAGPDGRWRADAAALGLSRPLLAGDFGSATVVLPSGNALTVGWAPIRVEFDLDSGEIEGDGPAWSRPEVAILDAAGVRVGRRADRTGAAWDWYGGWSTDARWRGVLGDEQRASVQPIDGDQLRVTFRSDAATIPIPPLTGVVHAADGLVVGRTIPGGVVACTLRNNEERGAGRVLTTTAAASGLWRLSARDASGLSIGTTTSAACTVDVPPHRFRRTIAAPGLTLDLDRGLVAGRVSAGVAVTVSRTMAGRMDTTVGRADPEGGFRAAVPGGAADPPAAPTRPLAPGDIVTVAVPDPRGGVIAQAIDVPPLDLALDPATNHIAVTTLPSTTLELSIGSAEGHQRDSAITRIVPPQGHVDVDVTPLGRLWAGVSVVATVWSPTGHQLIRRRFVPGFDVPIGGHRVCVVGVAGETVSASLVRVGHVVARGDERVAADGSAAIDLVDGAGRTVATEASDVLHIVHGQGSASVAATLTVPPLAWAMDWDGETVEGTTMPNVDVGVGFSSRVDCAPIPIDVWAAGGGQNVQSDPSGRFRWRHEGDVTFGLWDLPDTELGISLALPGGHTAIARGRALRADALVDTPWLMGEGDPGAVVTAAVDDAAGRRRASGSGSADAGGRWRIEVAAAVDTTSLRPGDRVAISSGAQHTALTVQPFGFDWIGAGDIAGVAPPDATVTAAVELDPRLGWAQASRALAIAADGAGAWAIPAGAGRRGWALDEAVALTAGVRSEGRNRTVAMWRRPVELARLGGRALLPWAGRGR